MPESTRKENRAIIITRKPRLLFFSSILALAISTCVQPAQMDGDNSVSDITFQQAREMVEKWISNQRVELKIIDSKIAAKPYGWIFPYMLRSNFEPEKKEITRLPGANPKIVLKDGRMFSVFFNCYDNGPRLDECVKQWIAENPKN